MSISNPNIGLANAVYTWAYGALIAGAILTALSTVVIYWASGVRDKFSDRQIASLELQLTQAKNKQTELQIELEKEKIERSKFEGQFAWRVISRDKVATLISDLSKSPGAASIGFVESDPEATFFACQIRDVFVAAKWKVQLVANTYSAVAFFGIFVPDSDDMTSTTEVRSALQLADIPFSIQAPPNPSMFHGMGPSSVSAKGTRIVIGSRPLPGIAEGVNSTWALNPN